MKRIFFILLLTIFPLTGFVLHPVRTEAKATQQTSGTVVLSRLEKHFGTMYVTGNVIQIDGEVIGDLYVAANHIIMNGSVSGDIIGLARRATINGSVDGDVRLLAQSVELYGTVSHNISFIADQITIRDTAQVKGSITGLATNLTVLGPVAESIEGKYTNLLLASDVGKDVNVSINNDFNSGLHILATARINGDVRYQALQLAQIAKGAVISGNQNYDLLSAGNEHMWLINFGDSNWWLARLGYFASLLLTALILWRLGAKRWQEVADSMLSRSRKSLWYGLPWLVFAPLLALMLIITLIGLPLGLVLGALYLASWYFYPAWACLYVTTALGLRFKSVKDLPIPWQIMLGLIIIIILQQLPFVGWFFSSVLYLLTVGAIIESWLRWLASKKS